MSGGRSRPDKGRRTGSRRDERGISALWTAVIFLFLTGSAALAIDASGGFNLAQTDQNTADLACLAGVKELPDATNGINVAYAYASANWSEMAGITPTIVGETATYADGNGNEVYVDAEYLGDSSKMYVRITEVGDTYFGKTVGQNSMTVRQEAACSGQSVWSGTGMLPIGALAGSWNGDLFDCAAKVTGNCGALAPDGNGANAYRDAVANGIVGDFVYHWGNGNTAIDCFAPACSVSKTEPGNMVGPWNQGLTTRFTTADPDCGPEAGWFYDCSIDEVLGETARPLSGAVAYRKIDDPTFTEADLLSELNWQDSIYGTFAAAKAAMHPNAEHYYYNGDTLDCASPRLATVPVVNKDVNWDLGDGAGNWPNGRKDMKFIGFYTIYIREPSEIADIGGPMDADVIWFGPSATCSNGEAFQPTGSTQVLDLGVKLVAP